MAEKKQLTLEERFEKNAASKAEAKRLCKLMENYAILDITLDQLLSIPGMGRKGALVVMQVACDIKGKK